jgi:cAMP-specific phosphodiesterase 4
VQNLENGTVSYSFPYLFETFNFLVMGNGASASSWETEKSEVPNGLSKWSDLPLIPKDSVAGDENTRNFRSWDFDIWLLELDELLPMSMHLINDYGLPSKFGFTESHWYNFVTEVRNCMKPNPYHNYRHIMDVFQSCACIVGEFDAAVWLQDADIFALFLAAIVHDLEHPGTNNVYQVNAETPLAIRYNDISVLENHHSAKAFEVFSKPGCNITALLSTAQRKFLRKTIIALVLSTDMVHHFTLQSDLNSVITRHMDGTSPAKLDEKDTLSVLKCIIHTSDISNTAKSWKCCKKWSDLVLEEFLVQGDREKDENLPVSMNCDRNTTIQDEMAMNFCDFIVAPFFFSMAKLLPKMLKVCKLLASHRNTFYDMYCQRVTEEVAVATAAGSPLNDAAVAEARVKWEGRLSGFKQKYAELEACVEPAWTSPSSTTTTAESATDEKK